jgi:hypothetical protein
MRLFLPKSESYSTPSDFAALQEIRLLNNLGHHSPPIEKSHLPLTLKPASPLDYHFSLSD